MEKQIDYFVLDQVQKSLRVRIRHFEKLTKVYPFFDDMTKSQWKRAMYCRFTWLNSIVAWNQLFPDEKITNQYLEDQEHVEGQTFMCPA